MAGVNQKIMEKRLYDFSNVLGAQSQTVVVAKAVPIAQWREVLLVARLHDRNGVAWVAGQTIAVRVLAEAFTNEDPNADFLYGTDLASASFVPATAAPGVLVAAASFLGNNKFFGGYVRILLTATQAAVAATLQAHLSIDLSLKA